MHRWFFADQEIVCKPVNIPPAPTPPPQAQRTPSASSLSDTTWIFRVKFKGRLCYNETVAVCGSNDALGNWNAEKCLSLNKTADSSLWSAEVSLPRTNNVRYRYLICTTDGQGNRYVRFWETHKTPRLIRPNEEQNLEDLCYDTFGVIKKVRQIQRGWLTQQAVVVQLKFYQAPFILKRLNVNPTVFVKVTAAKIKAREKCQKSTEESCDEKEAVRQSGFVFCEVASLDEKYSGFHYQDKYGTSCGAEDMLMFHLTVTEFETTAYLIDLYSYPTKAAADVPPYHVGYHYILPPQLKGSEGTLKLKIMCATKHRSMGIMTCDYLVVKPLHSHGFNLKDSCQSSAKKQQTGTLDIGHRGCGSSHWFQGNILRENTLHSFNVAHEHGTEMVEFDVQLTHDKLPVIYHDYQLYVSRKSNLPIEEYDVLHLSLDMEEINFLKTHGRVLKTGFITVPLNRFTTEQLKRITVYETSRESSPHPEAKCENKIIPNLPFPTLKHVLQKLPLQLGCNIEIKWPQKLANGLWEENFMTDIDKNEYVDIILDVVFNFASTRHIVLSSFDADICTMMRLKQPRYPVMFICHAHDYQPKFIDPRGDSILTSLYFASSMELYGVVADSWDILQMARDIPNLHERNLRLFAWGTKTRCEKHRKTLKASGVDGIIFDRVNHVLEAEDLKQNVVLIELRTIPLLEDEMCNGEK